jgi:hypothetical protein
VGLSVTYYNHIFTVMRFDSSEWLFLSIFPRNPPFNVLTLHNAMWLAVILCMCCIVEHDEELINSLRI